MIIKDERVSQLNDKIQSEAYSLVLFLSILSVFIKCYIMDMPFSQYSFEFGLIILSGVYIVIRSMLIGHDFMGTTKSKKGLLVSLVLLISFVISVINGIRNYSLYGDKYTGIFDGLFIAVLLITFISAAIFISIVFAILYWCNRKGQQRIEKKLNEED